MAEFPELHGRPARESRRGRHGSFAARERIDFAERQGKQIVGRRRRLDHREFWQIGKIGAESSGSRRGTRPATLVVGKVALDLCVARRRHNEASQADGQCTCDQAD